ncbi:hypothetical protein NDU88_000473 [Pleurodeles waltl]|uniref:Uncharacterized protein n=1 Tax=Pleurodeles waltl TaxID=8319 RepID=A0AAV7VTK2_PLEWA|nr:hypothetical protein NDU88_000473 [Pleurodeles waltl]
MAETANIDSHFNTPTAMAVETNRVAVTANRQVEDKVPPTVFQHAYLPPTVSKTRQKQYTEGKPLTSRHPMRNQDAMEPELHVLPMLVFLLLYQEQDRRCRRPRCGFSLRDMGTFFTLAGGGMSLASLRGTLAALMGGALDDPAVAGTTVPGDLVAEVLGWDLESLALGEGRGV